MIESKKQQQPPPPPPPGVTLRAWANYPTTIPDAGVVLGLPFPKYCADTALSRSNVSEIAVSPAHFQHRLKHPPKDTPKKRRGRVAHLFCLEPNRVEERVVVFEGKTRQGKAWEAFAEEHADKEIITAKEHEEMLYAQANFSRHPVAGIYLASGFVEVSAFAELGGVRCKARPDMVIKDRLADMKFTDPGIVNEPGRFRKHALDMGYHREAAWRLDVMTHATGKLYMNYELILVPDEGPTEGPGEIVIFECDPAFIALGRQENDKNLELYKHCMRTGRWAGFTTKLPLMLPDWARADA